MSTSWVSRYVISSSPFTGFTLCGSVGHHNLGFGRGVAIGDLACRDRGPEGRVVEARETRLHELDVPDRGPDDEDGAVRHRVMDPEEQLFERCGRLFEDAP